MDIQEFIPVDLFCRQHNIEISFISSLQDYGLIELIEVNHSTCIPTGRLGDAEKIIRLYSDLDINLEGIDAITHLLLRIKNMQDEILALRNRLRRYEDQ